MPRPQRIDYPGAWHHVFNRGAGKKTIFHDDLDRRTFLDLLGGMDFEVHGYALMGNHYHLIARTQDLPLSDVMRHLGREYAIHHNRRHNTDGPLFRNRFRSIHVDADTYLSTLSRYVHRNPVAAGLVAAPAEYEWSSCAAYLGQANKPSWLHLEPTTSIAGGEAQYQRLMDAEAAPGDTVRAFLERPRPGPVLGNPDFAATARELADARPSPRLVA